MTRETYHVVPNSNGGWSVKKGGGRTLKNFKLKVDAESYARQLGRSQKVEVVIHGKDGKIQNSDSYGNDPYPPKDKR